METMVTSTCKALADPADLLAYHTAEELTDEDGLPDEHRILQAEAELLKRKPHLRARKATGSLDQGARSGSTPSFSFSDWIRGAAG